MAQRAGGYWPENLNRFHPYGRGIGRGKVSLASDSPGKTGKGRQEPPLGFIVDRVGGQSKSSAAAMPQPINFVSSHAGRLSRTYVLFVHNLPPFLEMAELEKALTTQLRPYGTVTIARNRSRTSARIQLVNHVTSRDFDPEAEIHQSLIVAGIEYKFSAVFRDVNKRLVQVEEVNYKQIEAHIVLAETFDRQVDLIREQALLTPEDLHLRQELRQFLENLFNFKGFDCSVSPIGSSVTGLGLRDSDFDVFVNLRDYDVKYVSIQRNTAVHLLSQFRGILRQEFNMFIPNVINARCPIIKVEFNRLLRNPNGLMCDVSISNVLGTFNSKIMKHFLDQEPLFRDLAAVIKYWLSARGLIGPNQITSYGCLLLVMFYLQSVLVLPSLYQLQFSVHPDLVEGRWNVAFDESRQFFTYSRTSVEPAESTGSSTPSDLKKPKLSSLFLGFFNFYAKFPFGTKVICPHYGCTREKHELFLQHEFRATDFSIQDLIQLNSNVGQNMTDAFFKFFRKLFKLVDHMIASFDPSLSDDEAARKILIKMVESVDDRMVDALDVSKCLFQDQPKPGLVIKSTTIDVTQEFLKIWAVKSLSIVEATLRDVLQFTEYTRIDLMKHDVLPTHQSYIGQFLIAIRGDDHLVWQRRNDVLRQMNRYPCVCGSADFVDVEKQVTQRIREEIIPSDDVEVDIAVSDDDVVLVREQAVAISDVSLSFKLQINFSVNSQLLDVRFDEEVGEEQVMHDLDNKKRFWTREFKVFLSNYLLDHVQHAYIREYS